MLASSTCRVLSLDSKHFRNNPFINHNIILNYYCSYLNLYMIFAQMQTVKKLLDREATRSRKEEEKVQLTKIHIFHTNRNFAYILHTVFSCTIFAKVFGTPSLFFRLKTTIIFYQSPLPHYNIAFVVDIVVCLCINIVLGRWGGEN